MLDKFFKARRGAAIVICDKAEEDVEEVVCQLTISVVKNSRLLALNDEESRNTNIENKASYSFQSRLEPIAHDEAFDERKFF